MKESTRNLILLSGFVWSFVWIFLWILKIGKGWFYLVYEIPGILLILVALYNWRAGEDISCKQIFPIENVGVEYTKW